MVIFSNSKNNHMQYLKTIVVFVTTLALIAHTQIKAQTTLGDFRKMPPEQKAKLVTDSLSKALQFTTEEYSNVYPIIFAGAQKARAIIKSDDGRLSKGRKLKALLAETEKQVMPMLTTSQLKMYTDKKGKLIAYYRKHWQDEKLVFMVAK
jgi:hypothetical protein